MGEIHVNMHVTLDGVIQANGGPTEEDAGFEYAGWETPYGDAAAGEQITADVQASDALLLGRTTYDIFRRYWPGSPHAIGQVFDRVPKYVASRGTPELSWDSTVHVTDVGSEVRALREQHREIHTWGSADLLQTLLREGLVDQVNLWMYPIVIGQGKKLFPDGTPPTRWVQAEPPKAYPGGATLLRYRCLGELAPTAPAP